MTTYHFECPVCDYDDTEASPVEVNESEDYLGPYVCGLCASDSGKSVRVRMWPAIEGLTRLEAREVHREKKGMTK